MASGSIPVVFPPRYFQGNYYMDGGTTWNLNISSAVNGCKSLGFDEEKIIVDIFICTSGLYISPEEETGNTIANFLRGRAIRKHASGRDAIQTQLAAFPKVQWRYLITQFEPYGGLDELNFNNDMTWPLQLKGRDQAKDALAYGPGYGFDWFQ
jgi:hypothetical protein